MISKKDIQDIANYFNKKISKDSIDLIESLLNEKLYKIIEKSSFESDLEGRKVIKKRDIKDIII